MNNRSQQEKKEGGPFGLLEKVRRCEEKREYRGRRGYNSSRERENRISIIKAREKIMKMEKKGRKN